MCICSKRNLKRREKAQRGHKHYDNLYRHSVFRGGLLLGHSRGKLFNLLAPVQTLGEAYGVIQGMETVDAVPVERKSVSGYEGLYEVDNLSRVFSLRTGKQMKQMVNTRGYKTVALTKEGKTKCVFVHRMVAEAFVPNDANFPFVNHKDEDKTNNLPENLEWCTARYNANYGTAIKRRVATLKRNGTSTKGRPSEKRKQIVAIDENGAEIIFENSYEAAEKTGVDRRNIYACCQGKKKRLNGYKFDWVCGAKMDERVDGNGRS